MIREKFNELDNYDERLSTFLSQNYLWERNCPLSKFEMAEAGLSYLQQMDQVQCFHCRGILHSWLPSDNCIEEHKRLYPQCLFIQYLHYSKEIVRIIREKLFLAANVPDFHREVTFKC